MENLSVRECLRFGWQTFKARPGVFVSATLIIFVLSMALQFATSELQDAAQNADEPMKVVAVLALVVASAVLGTLIEMGMNAFYLKAHDAPGQVQLKDLKAPHPFMKYFGAKVVAGALVIAGLLLLIIPGVILALLFSFVALLVMDKHLGPLDALRASFNMTKKHLFKILLLSLAVALINTTGFLALGIGLLVSIPVSLLAFVHAYRTLLGPAVAVPVTEAPSVPTPAPEA